jgi:capsular exopolysaccharide synthesis family protein
MAQEMQEIDVRRWISRILKNWYWFVIGCIIAGGLGVWHYFSTTYKFTVDSEVVLRENDAASMLPQADLMNMLGFGGGKAIADEMLVMNSRDMMRQVIDDLGLQTEYRKKEGLRWLGQYPGRDLSVVYPTHFVDTMLRVAKISIKVRRNDYLVRVNYGRFVNSRHKVKDLTVPFETCAATLCFDIHNLEGMREGDCYHIVTYPRLPLINAYCENFQVSKKQKDANVISISTVTDMPSRGRDVIQKLIELYNAESVMDKTLMAKNTETFLNERLSLMEKELAEAEQIEVQYQESHNIVDIEEEAGLFLKENAEYRKKMTEIETQLNLVQFVLDFVEDDKYSNQLIPANLGITDPALVMLITEYNELMLRKMRVERSASGDNPVLNQMHSQLSLMRENVIATMISVRETLMIAKNDLEKLFYVADVWRDDAPAQIKQYREVVRMKLMKEKLYLFLYQKREENALSLVAAIPPAKIIAVPQMNPIPLSPKWKYYALICLFLGMGFPLGIMILGDMFNNRISMNSKDLEKNLKVTLAGVIANNKGESVVIREGDHSVAAEMFRTLRTNIRLAQPTGLKCPVVLVTSNVNDEGKSHVAINLAISMAMVGKKVALLEMDFRKPSLAKYLNLSSQGNLTDYLSNKAYMLEDVIVDSSIKNLDVLPVGVAPSNPSELLQSDRTETLFADLRERYDYVVVDSAPVSMVSDTFLLGGTVDMTVFVVRADYTTFEMIDSINRIYEQERLPNMLAVLNGVNAKELNCSF